MSARAYKRMSLCNFADQNEKSVPTKSDIMHFEEKAKASNDRPAISNVTVTLSQDAAAALIGVFNFTGFDPGFPIGTGAARAIHPYERQ